MPVKVDLEKLKATCDVAKFRGFERDVQQSVDRESQDRRRDVEDEKRAKEKRARKKRLKAASRAAA